MVRLLLVVQRERLDFDHVEEAAVVELLSEDAELLLFMGDVDETEVYFYLGAEDEAVAERAEEGVCDFAASPGHDYFEGSHPTNIQYRSSYYLIYPPSPSP